ncbi:hydroxymethylbilane synthase [Arthrospira platensis]|jgi:hydroxymethylbilane synthase|uniref:Porphobilinogen deaminase n=1 Tax=Limnospira platensis NIES-46 TaxID=1236695 RepID=A0A5M3TFL6_LIMPL|nr:hydroxymethylbilane synthase [Arthrospira platensis]AMW29378.1 hydroxymethylbilane synthase [Arthrospira platensis YZ]MBD2671830.1 hydroxymethylbilane synthase [Arthrospira platensis FACHB-439]MBD2712899.1 hydroxymethylbilane synthase [Arthrospira platensis FACHB-835]MDF2213319.1 hydroxymethylbilane synthase [Arthrospira platensis NCB002]MDT9185529.1 hydroxymethylbilane synthase [Limnospira sp. PMC 289.06]MDT9297716.1 hydroxymethylbilane synthase [Arthrospira platensis PCC 7345]MDT9313163
MTTSVSAQTRTIRIASRKSQLALVQTYWVQEELQKRFPDIKFEVHTMSTQGDKILDVALAKIGDKGLFTKELEVGMLNHDTDMAVHSLKDLPTNLPEGLMLGCVTEREDPADALVVHENHRDKQLDTLPPGAVVGTSSLRRLAQLRHNFPHLEFKDIRGNLNTRLQKLDEGQYDAIILAVAGLKRLGMADRIHQVIPAEISLHAVGQGALGIECREGDTEILEVVKALEHTATAQRCHSERAFLRELEGGCQVPIGVNTMVEGDRLTLTGMVASLDGKRLIKDTVTGQASDAEQLGIELANQLKQQGAEEILAEIFAEVQRS